MQVRVLGSGAGGGFPQWNCACSNCSRFRQGQFHGSARTQAQIAVSANGKDWVLLNASPDLHPQIEACRDLWPSGERQSPIRGVILTGGEIDQIAGLLVIREFQRFDVFATPPIRRIVTEDNSMFRVLARVANQVTWRDITVDRAFETHGLRVEPFTLPGKFPLFASASLVADANPAEAVLGLRISPISSTSGGPALAYLPGIGSITDALLDRLSSCNLVFFDGTFWTDAEPQSIPGITRTASQMGHVPVSGAGGSLERLAALKNTRKVYLHVNNTNPILDEDSAEHAAVAKAGWEVSWDGMEMEL
jgi:pyrroloquinoline quinone biosynthesis protein B